MRICKGQIAESIVTVQLRHYKAALAVFTLKPSEEYEEFAQLVTFIAQVATLICFSFLATDKSQLTCFRSIISSHEDWKADAIFHLNPQLCTSEMPLPCWQVSSCYPEQTAGFASEISDLLEKHYAVLNNGLRQTLVKALILLRNRNQVSRAP